MIGLLILTWHVMVILLWSGLVSRVGASHRVSLIAPFPLRKNCPRMTMNMTMNTFVKSK